MENSDFKKMIGFEKYDGQAIRWIDKMDHYELIFTDDFITPSSTGLNRCGPSSMMPSGNSLLTDIILDMRSGNRAKEVHVFVGSLGGEVAALNMILQQLLTYEYRVGINLGTACSCGWMLFFACQERYVSPFSQAMYHDISGVCGGKHSEVMRNAEFMHNWQLELLKSTDTAKVLSPQEMELGRTSEVWFTGQQLIERGAAKDYREYLSRRIPMPVPFVAVWGQAYGKLEDGWHLIQKVQDKPIPYSELVQKCNTQPEIPAKLRKLLDKGLPHKSSARKKSAVKPAQNRKAPESVPPEASPAAAGEINTQKSA